MLDLAISIINYKTKDLTANCLRSILNKKWQVSFKIWLIDNNSQDGSVDYLKNKFPKVKIIESSKNLGFAGGHNLALKEIEARYILILNSDTRVLDQVLDKMVEFMDKNLQVGISSCKVLGFDGKLQPNGGDLPFGMSLISWLFNLETFGINKPTFHRNDDIYYKDTHEVGWVSGNFMMVRKQVLEKVGFLNDNYFMYFEDVEFCLRALRAGFKIMINPRVSLEHLSGGSLDDPKFRQWLGEYKGLIYFYEKTFGLIAGIFIKTLVYISIFLRIITFTLTGKVSFAKTYGQIIFNL